MICERCRGCQSAETLYGIGYYQCRTYLGHQAGYKRHKLFRDKFCPCALCLVKVTCTDPKIQMLGYSKTVSTWQMLDNSETAEDNWNHKCMLLHEKRKEFWAYINKLEDKKVKGKRGEIKQKKKPLH